MPRAISSFTIASPLPDRARQRVVRALPLLFWLFVPAVVWAGEDSDPRDARRLFLTGRYEEAIEVYEARSGKAPLVAALGLADCYRATGRLQEAEDGLRAARQRQPKHADLAAQLALFAWERGDHDQARTLAEAAVQIDANQLTARWVSAELHRVAGRLRESEQGYVWFIDYYNAHERFEPDELRWIGLASAQYARWKRNSGQFRVLVNTLYPRALKQDENYWPAHLEMALLFLEKYNVADARAHVDAALAINPNAAEVHAVRAALALQDFDVPTARRAVDQALAIQPRLLVAHQLRADLLLAELRIQEAIEALDAARRLNPLDEGTLGRLAAAYAAADGLSDVDEKPDSRFARLVDEVTRRNPHCGEFFAVLADSLDRMRRYPDAARFCREADRRMPQLLYTRGQLGLLLMRLGDETEACQLLDESFRDDPFNVRVRNQLEVLDVLQNYGVLETEHFVIKYDAARDGLLARYASQYLEEQVYPAAVAMFGCEPPQKSLFEIFSTANGVSGRYWFSARMTGLPFVGTEAACAGKIVALTSPSELREKFNWARVLRHEFVHVVTLQQTRFTIPHWYTEALAVRFEDVPRPAVWNEVLVRRAKAGTLLNLDSINLGFIRPKNQDEWALAYCQAELYAEFMVACYGEDSPVKLLRAYADNLATDAAIRHCFGVDKAEFEKSYRAYVDQVVSGLQDIIDSKPRSLQELKQLASESPQNADAWAELAREYLRAGDSIRARENATKAQQLQENHPLAALVLARLELAAGNVEDAIQLLKQSLDEQSPQPDALALLAGLKRKGGDFSEAQRLYRLGAERYPHADKWQKSLASVYLETGEKRKLRDSLRRLAESDHDNGVFRKKLLELALEAEDFEDAIRWGIEALQIDVTDAEVHAQLGKALGATEKFVPAIEELQAAVGLAPQEVDWQLELANVCLRAGRTEQAVQVLKGLLAKYPQQEKAKQLLKRAEE